MDRDNLRDLLRMARRDGGRGKNRNQGRVHGDGDGDGGVKENEKEKEEEEEEGKGKEARVMLFGDFGGRKGEEVVDPYYGADDGFHVAYEQMVRFTEGFVREVGG